MELDAWTGTANVADKARRQRLTLGYAVGAVTVAAGLSFITYSAHGRAFEQDDTIDVSLMEAPDIPDEPEPELEPQPAPKQVQKKARPKAKVSLSTPTAVPEGVPDEADPDKASDHRDFDDVFDGEGGRTEKPKPVAMVKKVAPPPPPAPLLVSEREHSHPPVPRAQPSPIYPREAKADGVVGTVIVRYLVTAQGTVSEVRVLRGEKILADAVLEAVKQWRFEPGTYQGKPVPMWRTATFPFRLRS